MVRTVPFSDDRFVSWAKPTIISEGLETHRIVVYMDSDTVWNHPEIPLEWLLNHWDISSETSLAMSTDWAGCHDADGGPCANTGFVIAQQSERTREILEAWADCPTGNRFPGCEAWKTVRTFDQDGFNAYIKHVYNQPTDIQLLSCYESDGSASPSDNSGCKGVFISHFWADKGGVKYGWASTIMRAVIQRLHSSFLDNLASIVDDKSQRIEQ